MTEETGKAGKKTEEQPKPEWPLGEPRVERLRQILVWPLGIDPDSGRERLRHPIERKIRDVARAIEAAGGRQGELAWKHVSNGLEHIKDPVPSKPTETRPTFGDATGRSPFAYSEFVYFHDFVSRFLYRHDIPSARAGHPDDIPAFYLYGTSDIASVKVTTKVRDVEKVFEGAVERLNLYLFRTGVALLAVECLFETPGTKAPRPEKLPGDVDTGGLNQVQPPPQGRAALSIDDVLALSDTFRRAYVPSFNDSTPWKEQKNKPFVWEARAVPEAVQWIRGDGGKTEPLRKPNLADTLARSIGAPRSKGRPHSAPLLAHWRELLPLAVSVEGDGGEPAPGMPIFRHLIDERMPMMSQIELEATDRVLDWVPTGQYMRLCFVDSPGDDPFPYSPRFLSKEAFEADYCYDRFYDEGTRYLISPYSLIAIGAGMFFADTIVHHFRRMYFQMFMLAHFEFASLIAFSSRISSAIHQRDRHGGRFDDKFRNEMLAIHGDFLSFTHRFRFTGISNQVQPREMNEMMRKSMHLEEIFEDVQGEIEAGSDYLQAREEAQQTEAAGRLNIIASLGAVVGLALTAAGLAPGRFLVSGGLSLIVFALLALGLVSFLVSSDEPEPRTGRQLRQLLLVLAACGMAIVAICGLKHFTDGQKVRASQTQTSSK